MNKPTCGVRRVCPILGPKWHNYLPKIFFAIFGKKQKIKKIVWGEGGHEVGKNGEKWIFVKKILDDQNAQIWVFLRRLRGIKGD